jgi:hypothetical protein
VAPGVPGDGAGAGDAVLAVVDIGAASNMTVIVGIFSARGTPAE